MEDLDLAIVTALTIDGRMSFTDLATQVGLSTSAVHQRVKRLEERGVITGYAATVNYEALGLPLVAFIAIRPIDPAAPDDAPQRLSSLPQIESCHSVAGEDYYLLKVRVSGPGALEELLAKIRSVAGVTHRTTIVLSTPYEARPPMTSVSETSSNAQDYPWRSSSPIVE